MSKEGQIADELVNIGWGGGGSNCCDRQRNATMGMRSKRSTERKGEWPGWEPGELQDRACRGKQRPCSYIGLHSLERPHIAWGQGCCCVRQKRACKLFMFWARATLWPALDSRDSDVCLRERINSFKCIGGHLNGRASGYRSQLG